MWKCPECGRTFRNTNQHHYCGKAPETIDEYIAEQDHQEVLNKVRDTIRTALPDAIEKISWSMPTYWKGHNIIHFAAAAKHVGIYPGAAAVEHFADRLEELGFKFSKGSIQFPYKKEIPLDLIAEIAKWCNQTGNHA